MLENEFKKLEVISIKRTGRKSFTSEIRIVWPQLIDVKPGQFVMLESGNSSVMPRPFSVAKVENGYLSLFIKIVGKNTWNYCHLQKGDSLNVLGSLGKPLDLEFDEKNVILIGGGTGIAGIMLPASALSKKGKKVTVCLGGKNSDDIFGRKHFIEYECKTHSIAESGKGSCGLVTDLLRKKIGIGKCRIIACGPKPMLKCVTDIAREEKIPCTVILEEIMACGIGSCKGCAIFGIDGSVKHVCTDGPSFDANWIDWGKLISSRVEVIDSPKLPKVCSMEIELEGENGRRLFLKSPILTSSGCFEYDNQDKGKIDLTYVGAIVEKGLTLEPRAGNPAPRICEVKTGMLNSIGLENIGIKRFIKEKLPRLKKAGKPIIANLSGFSAHEYAEGAALLNDSDVDAIEVNISCPNIRQGKEIFGCSPSMTREVIRMVRYAAKDKFLITKHTPMAPNLIEVVKESIEEGTDAISLINTILGMSIDIHTRRPRIAMKYGGYSGPGIKPIGVRLVHLVFEEFNVPIIGMGGIENSADAIEYMLAGASAVAVGTGIFKNHNVFTEIYKGINEYLNKYNYISIKDIVGKVVV